MPLSIGTSLKRGHLSGHIVLPLLHVFQLLKDTDSPLVPGLERFHCIYPLQRRGVSLPGVSCDCCPRCCEGRGSGCGLGEGCVAVAERLDCETPDMRAYLDRVCPSKQVSETHQLLSVLLTLPLSLSLLSFYVCIYFRCSLT